MADRLSKINALVEYNPIHKDRLTKITAGIEYRPDHYNRLSSIMAMVEYVPIPIVGTLRHIDMNGGMQNLTGGMN